MVGCSRIILGGSREESGQIRATGFQLLLNGLDLRFVNNSPEGSDARRRPRAFHLWRTLLQQIAKGSAQGGGLGHQIRHLRIHVGLSDLRIRRRLLQPGDHRLHGIGDGLEVLLVVGEAFVVELLNHFPALNGPIHQVQHVAGQPESSDGIHCGSRRIECANTWQQWQAEL